MKKIEKLDNAKTMSISLYNEKQEWLVNKNPNKWMLTVLFIGIAIIFVNYCFADYIIIIRHSFGLLDCILNGNIFNFYTYATGLSTSVVGPGEVPYDVWAYLPVAIWNLPIYIYEKITGLIFDTNWILIAWAKLLFIFPFVFANIAIKKIAEKFNKKSAQWVPFLFSSSALLLLSTFNFTQIDIFTVCFTLWGVKAYLEHDDKKFLLFFALAIPFKMMAMFAFIPLVILKEKRFIYIIRNLAIGFSLSIFSKAVFFFDKMNTPTSFDEIRFSGNLFKNVLNASSGEISLFIFAFLALLVFCYAFKAKNTDEFKYVSIYVCFLAFAIFFTLGFTTPHWILNITPYIVLLVAIQPQKNAVIVLLLEIAASAGNVLAMYFGKMSFCFGSKDNISNMLLGKILPVEEPIVLSNLFLDFSLNKLIPIFFLTIFVFGIFALGYFFCPYRKGFEYNKDNVFLDKGIVVFRLFLNIGISLIPLVFYFLYAIL